ncbi:MAG: DUF2855 domain-containing protein [Sphingomonas sp.]|nr:DUF2855 domain-containing protein [Sphingomonas sp.]
MTTKLLVSRTAIDQAKIVERDASPIAEGEIRVATRRFALTANNISYALSGEAIGYWRFFPDDEAGWGCVPVWGFGEVVESRATDVAVGSMLWGFFPMASDLVMAPARVGANSLVDGSAHRRELPYVYNQYARTNHDPAPLAAIADLRSLMFPLLTTSYVIDDFIADNEGFGANQVVIGSASSKTAFGLAYYLRERGAQRVVGLTSARNIGFVEALGLYDQVVGYDALALLAPDSPSVFVDMSGDGAVVAAVHHHFGDQIKASVSVGATHWAADRVPRDLPGARPAFFFAPAQIAKRDADWGAGVLMRRAVEANIAACATLAARMQVEARNGADAIAAAYAEMVSGRTPPDRGIILSF